MAGNAVEARELVARRLRERLAREGRLSREVIQEAARGLGVHPRTVRRYVFEGGVPSGRRPRHVATDREVEALFENNGNFRRAYEQLRRDGFLVLSRRTFERGLRRQLRADELAFATEGEAGRRRHQLYLGWEPEHRNAVWEADHKVLDVWVVPDRRSGQLVRPSVIVFVDGATRAIMGYVLSLSHTADDVLAGLQHAVSLDREIGPFQGIPDVVRFDNGLEFLSGAFTDALRTLGSQPWAADPYAPHQKGKIERLNRTLADEFCAPLPFWAKAPRSANPKVFYGPNVEALDMSQLEPQLRDFVRHYNTARPHASLGGQTPQQRWESDPTPVQVCADSELRWLRKRRGVRKVGKDGIHFRSAVFFAPELNGLASEHVEIAYRGYDLRDIDVYRDGAFLCTARPRESLSAEDRVRFLAARSENRKRASNERRKASSRQRLRYVAAGLADAAPSNRGLDATGTPRPQRKVTALSKRPANKLLGLERYLDQEEQPDG